MQIALCAVKSEFLYVPCGAGSHRSLLEHNALGLSGGAGCVDHIGICFGVGKSANLRGAGYGPERFFYILIGKHTACAAVLEHISDTILWVFGVDRHISRARLVRAYHRGGKFLDTAHLHSHSVVYLHAVCDKITSDVLRSLVKLRVGIEAGLIDNGYAVRSGFCVRHEHIYPCLCPVICEIAAVAYGHHIFKTDCAESGQAAKSGVGILCRCAGEYSEQLGSSFDLCFSVMLSVERKTKQELTLVVLVCLYIYFVKILFLEKHGFTAEAERRREIRVLVSAVVVLVSHYGLEEHTSKLRALLYLGQRAEVVDVACGSL